MHVVPTMTEPIRAATKEDMQQGHAVFHLFLVERLYGISTEESQ